MADEIDITDTADENFTSFDLSMLENVRQDLDGSSDIIREHGYAGVIKASNMEPIICSIKMSLLNRRSFYLKEFMAGMELYELQTMIKLHPDAARPLFVNGEFKGNMKPDANFLFSLMKPQHAEMGTSKRLLEDAMMDFFQDTMIAFEDNLLDSSPSVIAWSEYNDSAPEEMAQDEWEGLGKAGKELMQKTEMNVPAMMGWLTGQRHKPVDKSDISIQIYFNHDCKQKSPSHSICFPIVSASGRAITFPVAHINTADEFQKVFVLAYLKG